MARRVPSPRLGSAHKVPTTPPGRLRRSGPMATGKTQSQSGEGKRGNPGKASSVLKSKS